MVMVLYGYQMIRADISTHLPRPFAGPNSSGFIAGSFGTVVVLQPRFSGAHGEGRRCMRLCWMRWRNSPDRSASKATGSALSSFLLASFPVYSPGPSSGTVRRRGRQESAGTVLVADPAPVILPGPQPDTRPILHFASIKAAPEASSLRGYRRLSGSTRATPPPSNRVRRDPVPADGLPGIAGLHALFKRAIDIASAGVLGMLALPIVILLIAVTRLDGAGPAIVRQTAIGRHGRSFTRLSLRSQTPDSAATRVGVALRRSRLDGLPQLWNVFRGEMTLIGPRPESPGFYALHREMGRPLFDRLHVKPGLVGLADVEIPSDIGRLDLRPRLDRDLHYVAHASPLLDTWIAVRAVGLFVRMNGR